LRWQVKSDEVVKTRVNSFNKYRHLFSGLLLLLYVFVTIPVQWLHYHESGKVSQQQFVIGDDQMAYSDQDSNQGAENCSICLHKYSSYSNDFFHPEIGLVELDSPAITGWIETSYFSNRPHYDNKGPPTIS
jgi:hypothetical protein